MQSFMIALLTCSITMSALALFYMAITPLLSKRYSAKGRYYTWLIVVIGLIIPFRPQFDNAVVKVDVPPEMALPIAQLGNGAHIVDPAPTASLPAVASSISMWQILMIVWVTGAIIFLAYHAIKHYRFVKLVGRWSERVTDEKIISALDRLKAEMGISKSVDVQLCASAGSPMMIGFIHPRILLPQIDFAPDELRFILAHELVHYKRKDLWYKALTLLATAIHWFNPVVYFVAKAIDIQCELSCDNEVIRHTDAETRQHYSEAIIGVVRYQSKMKTALSTNFYGGKKGMKKRIFSIMDTGKKRAGFAVICAALLLTLGTGAAFATSVNAADTPSSDTPLLTENLRSDELQSILDEQNDLYQQYADLDVFDPNYREKVRELDNRIAELDTQYSRQIELEQEVSVKEIYGSFGLSYNASNGRYYYENQLVRCFVDGAFENGSFSGKLATFSDGQVDVVAERSENGVLTNIIAYSPDNTAPIITELYEHNANSSGGDTAGDGASTTTPKPNTYGDGASS